MGQIFFIGSKWFWTQFAPIYQEVIFAEDMCWAFHL